MNGGSLKIGYGGFRERRSRVEYEEQEAATVKKNLTMASAESPGAVVFPTGCPW